MEKCETSSEGGGSALNPRPWQSYHTAFTNAKAGMDGVDKEKVQRVVYEMSKGSKYFENEERKEEVMRQKIEQMRAQCAKLTTADISHYQMLADKSILDLETTRDLSGIWLHVDMDAFYAAVETLSNPLLKGKPMAVGGMSMISTANYEARRFGVRAAMPGFIARKLCPELIFVPPDFKKYTFYSDLTRKVFQKYDPNFMATSLDEAYLDITDVCKERDMTGGEIAEELRAGVYKESGLTCSAGVAPNRLLAKVCSDINKPNGQFVLPNDQMAVKTFISSLPVRKIGGIGKVTEHILRDVLEINTCKEMLQKGALICALFSQSTAEFFLSVGLGLGKTSTPEVSVRKSISSERTFSATDDKIFLYQKLADIAEMLCADMQKEGLCGRTLTLKLKTASFEVRTRAVTLQKYIHSKKDILKYASKLLTAELPVSLRLIGLRVSHFNEHEIGTPFDPKQTTLTNFILSRDVSRKILGDQASLRNEICAKVSNDSSEISCSIDSCETGHYEIRDLEDNDLQDLDDHCRGISSNDLDVKKTYETSNGTLEKENARDTMGSGSLSEPCQTELSKSRELESSVLQLDRSEEDQVNKVVTNGAEIFWVDEYKCSICGIEIPPDFFEERLEHSDFHFAERIQKEESAFDSRTPVPRQRSLPKEHPSGQSSQKRRKPSAKEQRHIPIDMFFVKSNQNF
ncbi:hypothetical protein K2173_002415 [Erythroxylum novogranatense]|uniref:DNA polymerase kappa n=1 Tax=Erythroxylum novogranatense TaxID=1862640 RepID=A0AAV8TA25_9ROSI|nr:hypothetical protein K2173_002415 [Erythroxylum novogranatense]